MDERFYRIECEIRNLGEPGRLEHRENDPKSILTAEVSMRGEVASDCLINILKGMLDGDPEIAECKATAKYLENAIKEDIKKGRTIGNKNKLTLVASAKKLSYNGRPTVYISVYRWG